MTDNSVIPGLPDDDIPLALRCWDQAKAANPDATWAEGFRLYIEAKNVQQPFDPDSLAIFRSYADFCERRNCAPGKGEANLWGFGKVPIAFDSFNEQERAGWLHLHDLVEPTGIDEAGLYRIWREWTDEDRDDVDVIEYWLPSQDRFGTQPLFNVTAVSRLFMSYSPWSKEWFNNVQELMGHAFMNSGLADHLADQAKSGFVAIAHIETDKGENLKVQMSIESFDDDNTPIVTAPWDDAAEGETVLITEVCKHYEVHRASDAVRSFLGPKVDEEEATKRAFQGPTGSRF
ncbi:hypothetical protein [Nonomuraea endophytica]|uniref:hypothetical protein n=1 Tax=Nonomuraea endophytica TaxID=714136 RepID=UPI0037C7447B